MSNLDPKSEPKLLLIYQLWILTPACSRTPFNRGSCRSCTALEVNHCKFGTKKWEMDISKESPIQTFKVSFWKSLAPMLVLLILRVQLTPEKLWELNCHIWSWLSRIWRNTSLLKFRYVCKVWNMINYSVFL